MNFMSAIDATFAYIGQTEMLIVAGVALLLFGGAKLPELAKGLGMGIREFKDAMNDEAPKSTANTAEESKTTSADAR